VAEADGWAIPGGSDAGRYAALLEIAFDLSCLIDASGSISYASPSVHRLLGYTPGQIAHEDLFGCVHPDDDAALRMAVQKVLDGSEPVTVTGRLLTADGSYRQVDVTAVNLLEDPAVRGVVLAGRDLTGEQEVRRQAEAVADQLRVIVDNTPVIVFSLDAEGVITSARGRELAELGIDGDSLVGHSIYSFDEQARETKSAVRRCLAGEDVDITYEMRGRVFDLRYRPVREEGRVVGVFGVGTDITTAAHALDQLRASENRWRSLVAAGADAALIVDTDAVIRFMSPAGPTLFGWNPEDTLGRSAFEFVHPDDVPQLQAAFDAVLADPTEHRLVEFRMYTPDGLWRWAEVRIRNQLDDPVVSGVIGNIRDVTDRHEARDALAGSEARYRLIVETTDDGIALVDSSGLATYVNRRMSELSGVPHDELMGGPLIRWLDPMTQTAVEASREQRQPGQGGSYEIPFRRPDGEERHLLIKVTPLEAPSPHAGMLVLASDITQRKRAEAELERLALHDALTGLPNRALLLDRITGALTRRRRHGGVIALLLLDVDQFHTVNDSVGTAGGDVLLRTFTERLERTVRAGDTVARLGSDEFAVLTEELESDGEPALLADRLLQAVAEPVDLPGHNGPVEVIVTASIGVAVTMADTLRPEELLQRGELAMHRAKIRGRACYEVVSDAGEQQAVDGLRVVNELRSGLRRDELVLYYQPLVELGSGRIVGAEALARWEHPERGLLGPDEFIGLAEESGLIRELGAWVLRTACTDAMRTTGGLAGGQAPLQIAVNLSTMQLADPGLSGLVASVLADTGLPPHRLMLEVTETSLLANTAAALQELEALRRLGVQLALDDFGTGYSSLTYLKHFPLHELKIDRSFVSELSIDQASDAIVASVIHLARGIGLSVVAEGVETEAQRRGLLQLGCTLGQGYLFGRPVPAEQFATGPDPVEPITSW
jgi:diguanylate cyclase (GGDEF)-like protein/PAS domain S-box-containing protein